MLKVTLQGPIPGLLHQVSQGLPVAGRPAVESVDTQQRLPGGAAQPRVDRMPRAPRHVRVLSVAMECILCFLNIHSGFGSPIVSG